MYSLLGIYFWDDRRTWNLAVFKSIQKVMLLVRSEGWSVVFYRVGCTRIYTRSVTIFQNITCSSYTNHNADYKQKERLPQVNQKYIHEIINRVLKSMNNSNRGESNLNSLPIIKRWSVWLDIPNRRFVMTWPPRNCRHIFCFRAC